jgi:hypothetical protein
MIAVEHFTRASGVLPGNNCREAVFFAVRVLPASAWRRGLHLFCCGNMF